MKTAKRCLIAAALQLSAAPAAFAAGNREDSSGIFVWLFLAFCGLIVVAQLLPAVLVMLGVAKGIGGRAEAEKEAEAGGK